MNRLLLSARLVERSARRYTPAGLPVLELQLEHASEVTEDGHPRRVAMQIKALAIGAAIAGRIDGMALGSGADFAGFIAPGRNGRGVLFHITSLSTEPN